MSVNVSLERSSRQSSVSSPDSKSVKSEKALKEELRMAEMLTEMHFLDERQTTEFKAQNLNIKEQYVKSRARVKVLEDLESDSVNPAILHNSKINISYNLVNNKNIKWNDSRKKRYYA